MDSFIYQRLSQRIQFTPIQISLTIQKCSECKRKATASTRLAEAGPYLRNHRSWAEFKFGPQIAKHQTVLGVQFFVKIFS
jgi:hypothetical protein